MTEKFLKQFRKYDPMFLLCDALFGEAHARWVRGLMGLIVMTSGVLIAKTGAHIGDYEVVHIVFDEIGYAVHAMGATPYIEGAVAYAIAVRKLLFGADAVAEADAEESEPGA